MTEFTSVQLSLCLILALKFTVIKQSSSSVIVRGGDEVQLACENMMDPIKCLRIHWLFSKSPQGSSVHLVKFGQTNQTQAGREKADRLRVSPNCSLIIQRVSAADVGTYYCQQVENTDQKENRHTVALSLVNITEQKDDEEVKLKCSVISNDPCKHHVKWLLKGQSIDKDNTNLKTKYSVCVAEVTFKTSHYVYEPGRYNSLQCEVGESGRKKQQFPFRVQTTEKKNKIPENNEAEQPSGIFRWWLYIVVVIVLAAFLLAVGFFIKRKKNKGNKTRVNSAPAASQSASEVNQDPDEPDATISYASINLPKKNNNQIWGSDAAVTYSTVRTGVSPDPSHLYVSVK
ncbi:PREDICTED: uncharacterized protein LOC106929575 isoform X1 [Poecilia mexicana]|uniref:uncharacterized protein LOC106929575 isoform X1 n=1 Tax=Poecilia mexicana TaxID=48701 RepID=UPI00072E07A2|nr:PREDICTED: uncharacterized protein LOC106929575 isoform X1 [Poecilia mexicana]